MYHVTNCYIREFLAKPHPLLGRSGPTCPFVPTALRLDSIYTAVVRTGVCPLEEMRDNVKRASLAFVDRYA